MKTVQTTFTTAALVAALSLPVAGVAFAATDTSLEAAQPLMVATSETMQKTGDATSDTWITTKVKSALLAEDATPGMDIEVETNNGVVSLSGTVATKAEREMAIDKAKSVEGVREVSADGLKTTQ
jgi:hyperosmotically inducible protein